MTKQSGTVAKTTFYVTMVILISKAIGFVREMIMASYFGSDMITDAFNSAYSLFYVPVLLFSSCITTTLIPLYTDADQLGRKRANRFSSNVLTIFCAFALIISALMILFSAQLVSIVYPGFDPEKARMTSELARIMYPSLVFYVAGIVLSSTLNAQEHFLAAQLTGFPLSVSLIVAAIFFSGRNGIHAQAWGVFLSGALQIAILLPALRKDFRYTPHIRLEDPRFHKLTRLAVPAITAMAVNELNHMIDHMLASSLPDGSISAMSYAFKLITFMLGVMVVPVTTVSFSRMAKRVAAGDQKKMTLLVRESVETLLLIVLPIVAVAVVGSEQIIRLAFGRGKFTDVSVQMTSWVFVFYVIGVPFFGLRDLLNRVFHAIKDTRTPMYIAFFSVLLNIVLNLILRRVMGANGLALATSISGLAGALSLWYYLIRRMPRLMSARFRLEIGKIFFCGACAAVTALALRALLPQVRGSLLVFLYLTGITGASLLTYIAACYLLRVRQFQRVLGMLGGQNG